MQKCSPPPAKPRATHFLDLHAPHSETDKNTQKRELAILMKLLRKKKKIVVIAGAGISVGAGIPDFRSSNGLFTTLKTSKNSGKDLFDASVYKDDDLTASFHEMVRSLHAMSTDAKPTEFHQLLATLATEGRLLRLYSQNVDCIDTRLEPLKTTVPLQSKGPWPQTIQVHGGLEKMNCSKCGWVGSFVPELFVGSEPPDCRECLEMESVRNIAGKRSLGVGKLRPRIVLYNEFHPDADAIGAVSEADIKARPDAVIVVGTSLKVPGVKRIVREMCNTVRDYRGGISVWLNESDPPTAKEYTGIFDLVVRGDCEEVARLAKLPKWDTDSPVESEDSGEESFVELSPNDSPPSTQLEVQIPHHLPSPSLSPDPSVSAASTTSKSKKRTAAVAQMEDGKEPAKRVRTPTQKASAAAEIAKASKKKPATINNAFKATKSSTTITTAAKKPTAAAKKAAASAAKKVLPVGKKAPVASTKKAPAAKRAPAAKKDPAVKAPATAGRKPPAARKAPVKRTPTVITKAKPIAAVKGAPITSVTIPIPASAEPVSASAEPMSASAEPVPADVQSVPTFITAASTESTTPLGRLIPIQSLLN